MLHFAKEHSISISFRAMCWREKYETLQTLQTKVLMLFLFLIGPMKAITYLTTLEVWIYLKYVYFLYSAVS